MSAERSGPGDFEYLLDLALGGELEPLQRERLNTILRHSEQAMRLYTEQLAIQSALAFRWASGPFAAAKTSTAANPLAEQVLPTTREANPILVFGRRIHASWNLSRVAAVLAVAVGFYGTFALIASNMRSSKLPVDVANSGVPTRSLDPTIVPAPAVLVNIEEATTNNTGESFAAGREFRTGEVVELRSGLAEIAFASGAHIIVEGPAQLKIDSADQGRLTLGKLVAKVPPPAIGFTIETPSTRIVDLGTEFAAEVGADGASDVVVLSGLVSVSAPEMTKTPGGKPLELRAGQSISVPQGGALPTVATSSSAPASRFVRTLKKYTVDLPSIEFTKSRGNNPASGVRLRLSSGSTLEEQGFASGNAGALRVSNGSQTFIDLDCTERGPFAAAGVIENGKIGRDGSTLYVSWLARCDQDNDVAYAGLSLMLFGDQEVSADERLFVGKPFKTTRFGIDLLNGEMPPLDAEPQTSGDQPIPLDRQTHRFVMRIRFRPGADEVAVFVDPESGNEPAKANSLFATEVAFDRLRFAVGDKTNNAESACWQFDELRFGRDWNSVVPGH